MKYSKRTTGHGIVNKLINSLPVELHLPGYRFCGPGTKLTERLARGERGINKLDEACREHDIAYHTHADLDKRHQADSNLAESAWQRVKSSDSGLGEKAAALFVTNAMKTKQKFGMALRSHTRRGRPRKVRTGRRGRPRKVGMGHRRSPKFTLNGVINVARKALKAGNPRDMLQAVKIAHNAVKKHRISPLRTSRIIPVPKIGGILPLIPIFAGLSALGALAGGASSIVKTVNEAKQARDTLDEQRRHNQQLEKQAIGHGLFLQPYKRGCGVHVSAKKKKNFDEGVNKLRLVKNG